MLKKLRFIIKTYTVRIIPVSGGLLKTELVNTLSIAVANCFVILVGLFMIDSNAISKEQIKNVFYFSILLSIYLHSLFHSQ